MYWEWQTKTIEFWASFPQLLGTLPFNMSMFAAFYQFGWLGYDLTHWASDYGGAALCLLSGAYIDQA